MDVKITKTVDLVKLASELGVRKRDLESLSAAGVTEAEFVLVAPFDDDGALDGHIMVNPIEFTQQMMIVSRALHFLFQMSCYKILSRGILCELEKYSESDDAIIDATEAYHAEQEQMRDEALCDRTENND